MKRLVVLIAAGCLTAALVLLTRSASSTWDRWRHPWASGPVLEGHTAAVVHAAFSGDGARIVTVGHDDTVRVWDAQGGRLLATLADADIGTGPTHIDEDAFARSYHDAPGFAIGIARETISHPQAAFCENDQRVVSVGYHGTAVVWDWARGEKVRTIPGQAAATRKTTFSFGRREQQVARPIPHSGPGGPVGPPVYRYEQTWVTEQSLEHRWRPLVGLTPDGSDLVLGTEQVVRGGLAIPVPGGGTLTVHYGTVTLPAPRAAIPWLGPAEITLGDHIGRVTFAAVSGDGMRIVTTGEDKTARVYQRIR